MQENLRPWSACCVRDDLFDRDELGLDPEDDDEELDEEDPEDEEE